MRKHYPLNSNGAEDAGRLPWIDGVPSTGVEGSYPGQALFTDTEAEILAAIDASGQARNGSDLAQMIQAIARGIYLGQYSGTANALAAAIPNNVVFASLLRGTKLTGFVTSTNTAGVTVAITGIGPITAPATVTAPLLRRNGTALQSGDLPVNQDFEIRWDGNAFRMVGSVASDGGSGAYNSLVPVYFKETAGTDTWTPLASGIYWTRVKGAGGSGGGSTTLDCGGPGGGGGSSEGPVTIADTSPRTILVGAGGAAVAINTTVAGNAGGSSSALGLSATGGGGGAAMAGQYSVNGGYGGQGSGGLFNYAGQAGQASTNNTQANNYPNAGGAVGFTGGNCTQQNSVNGSTGPSGNGPTPGAGGSGGYVSNAGFKGADGAVYIYKLA